ALGVISEEQLERAVRSAFCALFTTKAPDYLVQLKPIEPPAIALIVQRLVQADCAGVLFTEDPIRREAGLMRIEAAIGLGVSVVDGSV
ncbi:PEP/pyruvate-binding domain-containing protein, partial [Klebsiella aerogenes]|uniref:PEP/pyruvate-binding domain-containing protein n=1 Tax=Klebsiella aerogenes TaxID=548 RepID=UPI001CC668EE